MTNSEYANTLKVKVYQIVQISPTGKASEDSVEIRYITMLEEQAKYVLTELRKGLPAIAEQFSIEEKEVTLERFMAELSEILYKTMLKISDPKLFK